ncbi:hypothetical protein [Halobacterium salinarum]|uniref:hypothetical protein n=1 Tax=Halobacterium salinarum TaxID=2242 RepID=UPI003904D709
MASYSDLELWAVVSAIYYDRNEIVTCPTGETRGHVQEAVTGLQAELLHAESIEEGEDVGQPGEVFITPRDILEVTTYTELGTVRRRLDELVDDGLLDIYGDLTSNPEGEHRLYLPANLGHQEVVRTLHDRDGRPIPESLQSEMRTHVTPSDFNHSEGAIFELERDGTVQIDVGEPADGRSIQAAVGDQLAENALTADLNNFVYILRTRANLTDQPRST